MQPNNAAETVNNYAMIVLNIKALCKARGIKNAHAALCKAGISPHVATAYLKGKKPQFVTAHIELLCRLLRCTPNDLFKWQPDTAADDYPENPLQAIRHKPLLNLEQKLKNMSIKEIEEKFGE